MLLLLAACKRDPEPGRAHASSEELPEELPPPEGGWQGAGPGPTSEWVCSPERDPDYADWPGGLRLRLELGELDGEQPLDILVSGAWPGERLEIRIGAVCALDCPPELDGACFQPAQSQLLAETRADAHGMVSLQLTPDLSAWGSWFVLQATAPQARALSQPVVDRSGAWSGPLLPEGLVREVGPITVRGLPPSIYELWSWPVAPGRRVQLSVQQAYEADVEITAGSITEEVWSGETIDHWVPVASRWSISTGMDDFPAAFDLRIVPTADPVPWYPDLDGDGYGDPDGEPTLSRVPVTGASTAASDCDDGASALHPAAPERCGDGVDQDCDGFDRVCEREAGGRGTRVVGEAYGQLGAWFASGDLDGDGTAELIAGSQETTPRPGAIWTPDRLDRGADDVWSWPEVLGAERGASGDLTGDGQDDLVLVRRGRRNDILQLFAGPLSPSGPWSGVALFPSYSDSIHGLALGDLTGDGRLDLLVTTPQVGSTWSAHSLFDSLGTVSSPSHTFTAGHVPPLVADLDGDGISDVISGDGCARPGPLPSSPDVCLLPAGESSPMTSGDIDQDGVLDALMSDMQGLYIVQMPFAREGSLRDIAWATVTTEGHFASLLWAADLAGPGEGRLLVQESSYEGVWSARLPGPGAYEMRDFPRISEASPGGMWAGDFDGDGAMDVAVGDSDADWMDLPRAGQIWLMWGAL